jgi:hypothetical protein
MKRGCDQYARLAGCLKFQKSLLALGSPLLAAVARHGACLPKRFAAITSGRVAGSYEKDSLTRSNAGWLLFLILSHDGDRPGR